MTDSHRVPRVAESTNGHPDNQLNVPAVNSLLRPDRDGFTVWGLGSVLVQA